MLFEFNLYSTFLLFGFLQGVIYAFILTLRSYRENQLSDRLLALLLLICSIYIAQYMLGFAGWYDSRDWHATFMFYFPFHLLVFLGPVIYFYFRSLTNQDFCFKGKDWWHFLPGIIVLGIYLVIFVRDLLIQKWMMGNALPDHYGTQGAWSSFRQSYIPTIEAGIISTMIYTILTIIVYRKYRSYLNNNFSETTDLKFGWLRVLLYAVIIGLAINWLYVIAQVFISLSYQQYWTSFFAIAVMIYIISIQGHIASYKLPRELKFEPTEEPPAKELIAKELPNLDRWTSKLENIMQEEKLFLQPNLTLGHLAQRLGTNKSILSKAINQGLEKNFNDYINQLRVREVEQLLQDEKAQNLTLMGIALDCGFNSKATFNRAFKKFTGQSPRDYLQKGFK